MRVCVCVFQSTVSHLRVPVTFFALLLFLTAFFVSPESSKLQDSTVLTV